MPFVPINIYSVQMSSSRTTQVSPPTEVARIILYEDGALRGSISFFPDGTALAPPVFRPDAITLHFNLSQFHATMDLLRNETPLYIFHDAGVAELWSGKEPVGEGE